MIKQETVYLSKDENSQLTLSSNFLEESVILTISSPIQDFIPMHMEIPAEDLEHLIQNLAAIYAEIVVETEEGPKNN